MSNLGLYEGPRYYDGLLSKEDEQWEMGLYNDIEEMLYNDQEKFVEHIWSQINDMLADYQSKKYHMRDTV